jgi:hypothetical protein
LACADSWTVDLRCWTLDLGVQKKGEAGFRPVSWPDFPVASADWLRSLLNRGFQRAGKPAELAGSKTPPRMLDRDFFTTLAAKAR